MKLVAFSTAFIISLCVACCGEEIDDVYYNQAYHSVYNNEVIQIENDARNFSLGETIFINSSIQNEQIDPETGALFYISDFLNEDLPFYYEIALYRLNVYGNIEKVLLNNESITTTNGDTFLNFNGSDSWLEVVMSQNDDALMNRFGITVLETGTYYLSNNYYTNNSGSITLATSNVNGYVQVFTTIENADENGLYIFTVN